MRVRSAPSLRPIAATAAAAAAMRTWLRGALSSSGAAAAPGGSGGGPRRSSHTYHSVPQPGDARGGGVGGAQRSLAKYYSLDAARLHPSVRAVYSPLAADADTQAFLDSCRPSFLLSLLAKLLRLFMSVTDANGILGRGQMFVMSAAHYRQLLAPAVEESRAAATAAAAAAAAEAAPGGADAAAGAPADRRSPQPQPVTLLDVGAGDGEVTARLAPLFDAVTVTEVSVPMSRRLAAKGYTTHVTPFLTEALFPTPGVFDVVSIHNVLDRCDHPKELLRGAIRLLRPGTGTLLLCVVLPFCEFVEDGALRRAPHGPLAMAGARCQDGATFEASLSALVTRVLGPLGLTVTRVAKVPYLCRGDMMKPYYVLPDAVLLCRRTEDLLEAGGGGGGSGAVGDGGALGGGGGGVDALLSSSKQHLSQRGGTGGGIYTLGPVDADGRELSSADAEADVEGAPLLPGVPARLRPWAAAAI